MELRWEGPSPVEVVSVDVCSADPANIADPMPSVPAVMSRASDPIRVPLGGSDVADIVLRKAA